MVGGAQDTGTMHFNPTLPNSAAVRRGTRPSTPTAAARRSMDEPATTCTASRTATSSGLTDAGDNWIRSGSTDIDCSPMTSGVAVDLNDGLNVFVPIRAEPRGPATPPVFNDGKATGLARSTDGGVTFTGPRSGCRAAELMYIATHADRQPAHVGRPQQRRLSPSRRTSTSPRRPCRPSPSGTSRVLPASNPTRPGDRPDETARWSSSTRASRAWHCPR